MINKIEVENKQTEIRFKVLEKETIISEGYFVVNNNHSIKTDDKTGKDVEVKERLAILENIKGDTSPTILLAICNAINKDTAVSIDTKTNFKLPKKVAISFEKDLNMYLFSYTTPKVRIYFNANSKVKIMKMTKTFTECKLNTLEYETYKSLGVQLLYNINFIASQNMIVHA